ncbi:MAG: hypothetical protein WBI63_09960 [Coriobacteriia bacterium]
MDLSDPVSDLAGEPGTTAGLTAEPDEYTTRMADWQSDVIATSGGASNRDD